MEYKANELFIIAVWTGPSVVSPASGIILWDETDKIQIVELQYIWLNNRNNFDDQGSFVRSQSEMDSFTLGKEFLWSFSIERCY